MANVVDTLVTRFTADTTQYNTATAGMAAGTARVATVLTGATAAAGGLAVGIAGLAVGIAAVVTAYVRLNAEIVKFGVSAFREFGQYDALAKSLEAVEGNAQRAADAMKVLRDVAKLPGIGLQEAIQAFTGLRQNGMSGAQSERTIRAVGNANALAGGGMEEFGRVMLAIRQILARPNLSGEELNQLAEAGIPAHRIIRDAFGTADGGELKRMGVTSEQALEALIQGLEKMPKAADSAKNSLENLQAAVSLAMAGIGSGMVAGGFTGAIVGLTTALEDLEANGGFKLIGEGIAGLIDSINPFSDGVSSLSDALQLAGAGVYALIAGLTEINKAVMAWVTGDWQNMKLPQFAVLDAMKAAAMGFGTFVASVNMNKLRRSFEDDPVLSDAEEQAKQTNQRATNHLAAIESNTRAMVDLQRHILGGGNIGAMGVTPIELSNIRRGGTGEEMVMNGIRMMVMELGVSSFGRRGMAR